MTVPSGNLLKDKTFERSGLLSFRHLLKFQLRIFGMLVG